MPENTQAPHIRQYKPGDQITITTDHGVRVARITAYGIDGTYVAQLRIPRDEITAKDGPVYRVGEPVRVPLPDGRVHEGRIVGDNGDGFCMSCHCTPINREHTGDGSLCCPGPWYDVTYTRHDDNGPYDTTGVYAEHEIYPAGYATRSGACGVCQMTPDESGAQYDMGLITWHGSGTVAVCSNCIHGNPVSIVDLHKAVTSAAGPQLPSTDSPWNF